MIYLSFDKCEAIYKLEGINLFDMGKIRETLKMEGIEFGSIRNTEDDGIEIIHDDDYIRLGPCGGIIETEGKWNKFNCFERDVDEFNTALVDEIRTIASGRIPIVNLGDL